MNKKFKITALLLTLILVFGVSAQATIAYLMDKTGTIENKFVPIKTSDYDFKLKVVGDKALEGWKADDKFDFILEIKGDDHDASEVEAWSWAGNVSVDADHTSYDLSAAVHQLITEEGMYEFRVYEQIGSEEQQKRIEYDDTVYQFLIMVKKTEGTDYDIYIDSVSVAETDLETDADSLLSVSEDADGYYVVNADFVNKYKSTEPPEETTESTTDSTTESTTDSTDSTTDAAETTDKNTADSTDVTSDDESKTGDDMNIALWLAIMIASGAVIVAVLLDRRRRRA